MKIALKYGLLITAGVILWVVVAHLLEPDRTAPVHTVGAAVFFNLLQITGLSLGIKERQREVGILSFKNGAKTGVSIAFVYGVSACLFFLIQLMLFGPRILARQSPDESTLIATSKAFAALFIGALLLGLVYSTIISFAVVRMQRGRRYD
ncbi:MAG TPA: hypothetical protein VJ023_03800 [Pyrinomonadaceae bacterium]|nr:hypothetical protein [Pyrinomonadaceae bacterium]